MKTKIDFTDESLVKRTVTTYNFDKFPLVFLEETKGTDNRGVSYSSRRVYAKKMCNKEDYLKQLVLWRAKYEHPVELPYAIETYEYSDNYFKSHDCECWYSSLAASHAKQNGFLYVPKEKYAEFEQEVMAIDFRVYDEARAQQIRSKYPVVKDNLKKQEVDAVAIEEDR